MHPSILLLAWASTYSPAAVVLAPIAVLQDSVDGLVQRGRAALEAGQADAALRLFEQASQKDGERLRTRVWVLRTWIAQGKPEDALGVADELSAKGGKEAELDYLYGLGFHAIALRDVQGGTTNAFTGQQFADAAQFLGKATRADAQRFRDAFVPLAESAWYVPDLAGARAAADKGVELQPKLPKAHAIRGRVALAQFVAAREDSAKASEGEAHRSVAVAAFEKACELLRRDVNDATRDELARISLELGDAYLWKEEREKAGAAYRAAISLAPFAIDYFRISQSLGANDFLAAVEGGLREFKAHRVGDAEIAHLTWWLAYAQFAAAKVPLARATFERALELAPNFHATRYYLFRTAYAEKDYEAAFSALRAYHGADAAGLAETLAGDGGIGIAAIEFLIGWCVDLGQQPEPRNLDAAFLCEVCTQAAPSVSRYWNNLGLFTRDHGELLRETEPGTPDGVLMPLWEKALAAYERALELEPESPGYLNDTALMLHYHLERDLERALAMYAKARANAEEQLQKPDLDPTLAEWLRIALRDSKDNHAKLVLLIERRKKEGKH